MPHSLHVLLALIACGATVSTDEATNEADVTDNVGRYGLYSERFCGVDAHGVCQWNNYLMAVGLISGAALVLGCCCCCAFEIIFCARTSCNQCGGAKPSYGCVVVDRSRSRPGYTRSQARLACWCAVFAAILPIPIVISALTLSVSATLAAVDIKSELVGFYDTKDAVAVATVVQVSSQPSAATNTSAVLSYWTAHVSEVGENARGLADDLVWMELGRTIALCTSLAFVALLCLIAIMNAACSLQDTAHTVTLLCNLMICWMWLLVAYQVALVLFTNDMCGEMRSLPSRTSQSVFNYEFMKCNPLEMRILSNTVHANALGASASACVAFDRLCSVGQTALCTGFVLEECQGESLQTANTSAARWRGWRELIVSDGGTSRRMDTCPSACTTGLLANFSSAFGIYAEEVLLYSDVLISFEDTLSCAYISKHLTTLVPSICDAYSSSVEKCGILSAGVALLLVMPLLTQLRGQKRFVPKRKFFNPKKVAPAGGEGGVPRRRDRSNTAVARDLTRALEMIPATFPVARAFWTTVVEESSESKFKVRQGTFQRVFRREYDREDQRMSRQDWEDFWGEFDEDKDGHIHVDELVVALKDSKEDLPGAILSSRGRGVRTGLSDTQRRQHKLESALALIPASFPRARALWAKLVENSPAKNRVRHSDFQRIFRREYSEQQFRLTQAQWADVWSSNDEDQDRYIHIDEFYILLTDTDCDIPWCIVNLSDGDTDTRRRRPSLGRSQERSRRGSTSMMGIAPGAPDRTPLPPIHSDDLDESEYSTTYS